MTSPETLELEAVDAALAGRYVAPEHAELAELALLLRDDRPEPEPAWATHLDRRVEAGFPSPPRARKTRVWLRKATPALAIAACLLPVVLAVTLIDGSEFGSDDEGAGSAIGIAAQEAPSSDESGGTEADSGSQSPFLLGPLRASAGDPGSDRRRDRDQRRSASLTLAAPRRDIDRVATRAGDVAADLGGFVQSSTISSQQGGVARAARPQRPARHGDPAAVAARPGARAVAPVRRHHGQRRVRARAPVGRARRAQEPAGPARERRRPSTRPRASARGWRSSRARSPPPAARCARSTTRPTSPTSRSRSCRGRAATTRAAPGRRATRSTTRCACSRSWPGSRCSLAAVLLPFALVWLLAWLGYRTVVRRRRERTLDMA